MMHSYTGRCMSLQIWRKIHRDVSEISIVSSWALTVVFHCEYQPPCWWISPFSCYLVTNSYRTWWRLRPSLQVHAPVWASLMFGISSSCTARILVHLMIQWRVHNELSVMIYKCELISGYFLRSSPPPEVIICHLTLSQLHFFVIIIKEMCSICVFISLQIWFGVSYGLSFVYFFL